MKNGRRILAGYCGVMGAQDGVDMLIHAMAHVVRDLERDDIQCAIVGSGTEVPNLKRLTSQLGLDDYITFTGFVPSGEPHLAALSAFDIGVIPDPKNVFNDKISMNKVFEYMTLGIPFVQFDLVEGRRAAGDASLYAAECSPEALAREMLRLADDEALRADLIGKGQERRHSVLRWEPEKARLLAAYETALASRGGTQISKGVATATD